MAGTEATLYEIRKGAAWITLNRPENRNALSAVLVNELFEHLQAANAEGRSRRPRRGITCRCRSHTFMPAGRAAKKMFSRGPSLLR